MTHAASMTQTPAQDQAAESTVKDYITLFKPRVMALVVFTAAIGAYLADSHRHPFLVILSILSIAVGAGASAVFNMWFDRDIDVLMKRTARRPLATGAVDAESALTLGVLATVGSVMTLGFCSNVYAAALLAFTIFFYAVVYTVWLKRWTAQNIVIGGAAGAFPPIIGWLAMTGELHVDAIILFTIIFLWTPTHFWALALFQQDDYKRANIPMYPNVYGVVPTHRMILIYAVLTMCASFAPLYTGMMHMTYGVVCVLLNMGWLYFSYTVKNDNSNFNCSRKLFGYSILYLFLLFATMPIDRLIH